MKAAVDSSFLNLPLAAWWLAARLGAGQGRAPSEVLAVAIVVGSVLLPALVLVVWLLCGDPGAAPRTILACASYYANGLPLEVKLANAALGLLR